MNTRLREIHHIGTIAEWNERVPVGTAVRYFPVRGRFGHVETRTRSIAWEVSKHPVVLIDGQSGGVHLDHLIIIEDGEETARLLARINTTAATQKRMGSVLAQLVSLVSDGAVNWRDDPKLRERMEKAFAELAAIDTPAQTFADNDAAIAKLHADAKEGGTDAGL